MATFFLDLEGGSDAADGTTFANRWLTLTSGATAVRIAPGDTIRLMAAPNETSLGQNATWTNNSKTVTLTTAVTANIDDGELAWTASANVTSTADTSQFKENTKSAKQSIAAAFTTGLVAFKATGALNLSGYQQVSFWVYNSVAVAASTLSIRLCTDTVGATSVHTIAIPAIASPNCWVPVTVDLGANLNAAIQSVALYQDVDIAAVDIYIDNLIACKASSSADALTLTSLIGKVWNLCWVASSSYAANDIRKPTQPNRNGFRYKVTAGGGGAAGATEPTWPQEVGVTVVDGALTWTCEGLEDTWYPIQSINGLTVKMDNSTNTLGSSTAALYQGSTEAVTLYRRECIKQSPMVANSFSSSTQNLIQNSGTPAAYIVFSGGWNRTDMNTQTGETWMTGQNGNGQAVSFNGLTCIILTNINGVRFAAGIAATLSGSVLTVNHCHTNANNRGFDGAGSGGFHLTLRGLCACNNNVVGIDTSVFLSTTGVAITGNGNNISGAGYGLKYGINRDRFNYVVAKGNLVGAGNYSASKRPDCVIANLITANNTNSGANSGLGAFGGLTLINAVIAEATPIGPPGSNQGGYIFSQKHGGVADAHLIVADGGTIISATDQRHTASGISWKFRPTAILRNAKYPLRLSIAKIACLANTTLNISIWTRRDHTNINGTLKIDGGQLSGIGADVSVACAPAINTWVQSGTLTVTPTEAGVIEVTFEVYDGVGTINNFWVDDLSVA